MAAVQAGGMAPNVSLSEMNGGRYVLQEALRRGPAVLAFFKITCPVCQYAFPFLERIYRAHQGKVNIVGVSQSPRRETEFFVREYGISFPVLLDEPQHYAISNSYGITNVPTIFLISEEGKVELCSVGWSRPDLEQINRRLAEAASMPEPEVFRRGEEVPERTSG